MNCIAVVVALIFVMSFAAMATDRPDFVKVQYAKFQAFDSYRERAAFAKPWAWGTGTYRITEDREIPFTWFAWTNTDAYFQMEIGTHIYGFDLRKIRAIKDVIKRPYEATAAKDTYIGLSNDWAMDERGMPFCSIKKTLSDGFVTTDYDKCDHAAALEYYLGKILDVVPQLQFNVVELMK